MVNRCVDVIVGLQAGSEAKGKLSTVLTDNKYRALVRTGGCNAAHSAYVGDTKIIFHQLPCGSIHFPKARIVLGAGAQIDLEHLNREIQLLKDYDCWLIEGKPRLIIDPNATVIDSIDKIAENGGRMPDCGELYFHPKDCEKHDELGGTCMGCDKLPEDSAWAKLGSTTHGTGANLIRKIARGTKMAVLPGQKFDVSKHLQGRYDKDGVIYENWTTNWASDIEVEPIRFASDEKSLADYIGNTVAILNDLVDKGEPVLLEGTQGCLLSLHHGYQNKTTSRDTNTSSFCAEAGISPLAIRDVYGVARTFPIRVAGESGPLSGREISWEDVTESSGSPELIEELTSATKRRRRVFEFGKVDFRKALNINRPNRLMLTFIDYLSYGDRGKTSWDSLSEKSQDWILSLEAEMGVFFKYLSTGPKTEELIIREG